MRVPRPRLPSSRPYKLTALQKLWVSLFVFTLGFSAAFLGFFGGGFRPKMFGGMMLVTPAWSMGGEISEALWYMTFNALGFGVIGGYLLAHAMKNETVSFWYFFNVFITGSITLITFMLLWIELS